ncbi:MAG: tyrosine-type recombinase/integrase [Desulfuromonadales bacterium]|nr:tyrosine-type recombinase/integrase [Desulfuromonadales bacterium]
MSLIRHPKYENIWTARIYPEGRKKDPKTGKPSNKRDTYHFEGTKEQALAWYASLCHSSKTASTVPLAPTIGHAWPQFCVYYKQEVASSTYYDYLKTWDLHLKEYFGQLRPLQLKPGIIEAYKAKRRDEISKRGNPPSKKTINKELSYISAMISWMSKPEINLCQPLTFVIKGYPGKQVKAPLALVPTREEVILLLRRASKHYRGIFATCYYAGLRKSEALNLRSSNINISQGYMLIKGKGEKQRIVPIYRKLLPYLRKRVGQEYLFTNPKTNKVWNDLKKPLDRAAKSAGIKQHVYLHLLRHSFGTHMIQSGVDLRSLQLLMGHSSSQVTEVYTTLAGSFLATQIDRLGSGALRQNKSIKT